MNYKRIIKKIPGVQLINNRRRTHDFDKDRMFYLKYSYNKETNAGVDYRLLTEIHKLEKSFLAKTKRPFGASKIKEICYALENCDWGEVSDYTLRSIKSALMAYCDIYEKNNWIALSQYQDAKNLIKKMNSIDRLEEFGSKEFIYDKHKNLSDVEFESFLRSRHSIREFSSQIITEDEIKRAAELASMSPSACNRQPVKVYYIKRARSKDFLVKALPGLTLFNMKNISFLLITYDYGFIQGVEERNQGWFNAGLFSMILIQALHTLGIGSCFLQYAKAFSEEDMLKKAIGIPKNERVVVAIACGHYKKFNKVLTSARRPVVDVYKAI